MKIIRILSVMLLVVSLFLAGGYTMYELVTKDTQAPVLTCDSDLLIVSVKDDEETILQGVTATDNRTEDIQDAIVVEKLTSFTDEDTRIVTYAAIDDAGNVGRCERILKYSDYTAPKFSLSHPLRFPTGSKIVFWEYVGAHSELDGDLSNNLKYTLSQAINLTTPSFYTVEFRVTDSTGNVSYLPLEVEVYDYAKERVKVELTEYLIYIPLNSNFSAGSYYLGADEEGELSIDSNVDTSKEGIYTVNYTVTSGNTMGKSRLIVVVGNK